MSSIDGFIRTSKSTLSFAFSVLWASNSICQTPAKPNVVSAVNFVAGWSPPIVVSVTWASIGAIFFWGLETLTLRPEISVSGSSSNDETVTIILFGPIPTGTTLTSNFAFSENNVPSNP